MKKSVIEVINDCYKVANFAKDGCPANTYAHMTSLIEEVIAIAPEMNQEFTVTVNSIVKEILAAQMKDDLIKISDFIEFELVYVLKNYQK